MKTSYRNFIENLRKLQKNKLFIKGFSNLKANLFKITPLNYTVSF